MRLLLVVGFCIAIVSSAQAQSGTFAGTVARDTLGGVITNAEVSIPELNRTTLTSPRGEFELAGVPLGRHTVTVRAIGYQLLVDTIDVIGGRIDADIVLTRTPVDLAPVKTTGNASEHRLPIGIQEMEDRRKMHMGGHFVTDSMLRANDEKRLTYFFSGFNVHQMLGPGTAVFLLNGRGNPMNPSAPCYIDVYIDGAVYFRGPVTALNPAPDFNAMWASSYSGIEFYPSAASAPAEYNGTRGIDCGTILLWTRRTP